MSSDKVVIEAVRAGAHVPCKAIMSFMMPLLTWLIQGALGPAVVGLPVTWAASDLAGAAKVVRPGKFGGFCLPNTVMLPG
jgi:hypothetical protein